LPQVVNFELPNVPEDYVHRIGRTGRAGSSGAAVSLVDREELKFLKDIEKLIKREIPKLPVEGFTPNPNPEPEAPRAPRQPHGRPPRGHQRSAGSSNQSQRPREANQAAPRGEPRPANNKNMSEAARHQAMPQPALFSPNVPQNNGRRHNPNGGQPKPGLANRGKPSSPHRSGGRGR
jgi:ATP-dependent RNA helicase RhlE